MQKKIIALAVAGLMSGAAFAQSNVQIYGLLDVGYAYIDADGKSSQSNIDGGLMSGSRLGFKGTENLGNGLTALFVLEYALANDSDTGVGAAQPGWSGTTARQQLVGLTGGFGTVVAGRAQTTAYDWACAYAPQAGSAFDPMSKMGAHATLVCGTGGRASNAFAYITPSFGGLTFAYNHARLTEAAGALADPLSRNDSYANMLSATYANGPIQVGAVWTGIKAEATVAKDDANEYGLGASYDFKVVKVFGTYQQIKTNARNTDTDKKWQLGVSAPIGANGTLAFSYADSTIDSTAASDDTKGMAITYVHNLSKRTNVYAGYSRLSNDGAATRGYKGITTTAGDDVNLYGVGLRHSF